MRRFVLLILGLCFLTSITRPGFSEKPLRLFFEKNISVADDTGEQHTVQQGEWLFKILSSRGYSGAQIQQLLPEIQAMNPHIPDLDRLLPGQVIRIPEGVAAAPPQPQPPRPSTDVPKDSYDTRAYVVQSGDTLVEILQKQGVPTKLIFGKYMDLFLELNPTIPDTNTLRSGQEIILPVVKDGTVSAPAPEKEPSTRPQPAGPATAPDKPVRVVEVTPGARVQTSPAPQAPQPAMPRAPAAPEMPDAGPDAAKTASNATTAAQRRTPRTGLPFIKTVLSEMRFRFMPGDESMFPLPGSGWLHVKMFETPLAETPWGARILFCPVPKSAEWIEGANRLGMKVCTISPNWSLQEVLEKVAAAFPDKFRLWGAGRDMVLTRGGIGLTLQAPQMAISEQGGKKTVNLVWARQTPGEAQLPQGLHEVLEEARVKVIELDAFNELSRLPTRPRESIYVPVATHMDLIRAINPPDPEAYFGQSLPADLNTLFQELRSRGHLQQGMAHASWSGGLGSRIALEVPAWIVSGGASRIILLDRRFADPYLVSVLSREGYVCFVLPD
jgi:murein DD-endopeptidase MepM/ murein hydrolase activator NlpD